MSKFGSALEEKESVFDSCIPNCEQGDFYLLTLGSEKRNLRGITDWDLPL